MTIKKKIQVMKRELILEEAAKLFIADGYENMKIVDLATNVGVSVGSIYTLFGSKENLYNNYIISQIEHYLSIIEEETNRYVDPVEKLKALAHIKFGAFVAHKNALREVVINDPLFFINVSADHDDPMMKLYIYITDNIMTPLSQSIKTKRSAIDMTFLFDGLSIGMIQHWIHTDGDLIERTDELIESFLLIVKER
jgi:AcrR family transcriptional regulator